MRASPVSSRSICQARSKVRCTSLACAPKCVSGRGFMLKSSGIGRIIGLIHETCTRESRSADDCLYKRDLYNGREGANQPAHKQKRPALLRGVWSGKRDSNSRPRPWQGRALPTELFPQYFKDSFLWNGTAKIRQNSESPNIFSIF